MVADPVRLEDRPTLTAGRSRRPARATWQRLLDQLWQLAGGPAELIAHTERAWASATFSGARHGFTLDFAGAAAVSRGEGLIADLPEHEFTLPGLLVADAAVVSANHTLAPMPRLTVTCELLLVEEG